MGGRARRHQPDHRPAAGNRTGTAGQGRRQLGRRRRPRRPGDHQHRDHARTADQRADPDRLAPCCCRPGFAGERYSVVQFCHPRRGRSCRRCRAVAPRTCRNGSTPCPPPTRSTRCSTRSTSSKTPVGCDHRRRITGLPRRADGAARAAAAAGPRDPGDRHRRTSSSRSRHDEGELVDRAATAVEQDVRPETHFTNFAAIVEQQLELADRHDFRVAAVGVGCPGPITGNCGLPVSPVNLFGRRTSSHSRERLRELTANRVYGDLDGKALALAEGWMGAAKGHDNYCVMHRLNRHRRWHRSRRRVARRSLDERRPRRPPHRRCERSEVQLWGAGLPRGGSIGVGDRGDHRTLADGADVRDHATHRPARRPGGGVVVQPARPRPRRRRWRRSPSASPPRSSTPPRKSSSTSARLPYSRQARITPTRLGDRAPLIGAGAVGIRGWSRDRSRTATEGSQRRDDEDPQHRRQPHPGPSGPGRRRRLLDSRARAAAGGCRSPAAGRAEVV